MASREATTSTKATRVRVVEIIIVSTTVMTWICVRLEMAVLTQQ